MKTDRRDARKLAELLRAGLLTAVRPPHAHRGDAGRALLGPVMPYLTRLEADDFSAYATERTISALSDVAERAAGPRPRTRPRGRRVRTSG